MWCPLRVCPGLAVVVALRTDHAGCDITVKERKSTSPRNFANDITNTQLAIFDVVIINDSFLKRYTVVRGGQGSAILTVNAASRGKWEILLLECASLRSSVSSRNGIQLCIF
jgi:hypothetical protein